LNNLLEALDVQRGNFASGLYAHGALSLFNVDKLGPEHVLSANRCDGVDRNVVKVLLADFEIHSYDASRIR
jgi:hypothetical protein